MKSCVVTGGGQRKLVAPRARHLENALVLGLPALPAAVREIAGARWARRVFLHGPRTAKHKPVVDLVRDVADEGSALFDSVMVSLKPALPAASEVRRSALPTTVPDSVCRATSRGKEPVPTDPWA